MEVHFLTAGKSVFYKKLFSLVLPIAFQQFMLAAVSASDALMLGVISQDDLSAVFFLASLFAPSLLMRIFTPEAGLISRGVEYLRIVSASYLFTGISQIYLCILKNTGCAVKSMIISSSAVVMNLFLNAALIYGLWFFPEMGVAGAALATSISKLIEMGWAYIESLKAGRVRLHIRYCFRTVKWLARDYWTYTLPMLGDYLVWSVGFSMYSVIMGHLGSDAVAANSIANIAKNLIVSFCTGLGNGGGIIVGNELGMGRLEEAKRYGGLLWKMAIISGILSGILLVAFSPLILNVTELTPQAAEYLKWMLILCACYMVAKAINMTTIAGIFPAGGDSRFGLICDAITMWAFAVPAGFLAAFYLHLPVVVVFLIINLDEVVKVPAAIAHYKKYKWLRNITR